MSARVTVTDNGANALLARARAMRDAKVRVGILADTPKRERTGRSGKFTLAQVAQVAYVHEFGAPGANIPQRSFIRATCDLNRGAIAALQEALAAQVLQGTTEPRAALDLLGAKVASMMQVRIASNIPPPLKPATIKRKGSSVALINTGQLRSSITWAVV